MGEVRTTAGPATTGPDDRLTRSAAPPRKGAAPSTRPLRGPEKALVALETFLSVCGLGGGLYLATHPSTAMPLRYLDGTWFHTWRWPGLALFFFVGICPALAAGAALRRMPIASLGHLAVGVGLMAWILLEAAWVVVAPGLQIVFGLLGLAVLALGVYDLVRRDPRPLA